MTDEYAHFREVEDKIIRDMLNSCASTVSEPIEKSFDPFEEHVCKGGMTETWLVPGGSEFWLIFNTEPKRFTWIEYCPYCGYHPPNLNFKVAQGSHDFPINDKSTVSQ
jgi:hypothetical protein